MHVLKMYHYETIDLYGTFYVRVSHLYREKDTLHWKYHNTTRAPVEQCAFLALVWEKCSIRTTGGKLDNQVLVSIDNRDEGEFFSSLGA